MQVKLSFALYVAVAVAGLLPFMTTKMQTGPQVASLIVANAALHAVFWAYFAFFRSRD